MPPTPQLRRPSGLDAFRPIAQSLGQPTPGGVRAIHQFASQNPQRTLQLKPKKGLIYTQDTPPAPRLCVTTPPAPARGMPAACSRLPWAASPVHSSTLQLPSPAPAFKIAVSLSPRRFA